MEQKSSFLTLPGAIIIAGALIAIAIIWVRMPAPTASITAPAVPTEVSMAPVTSADHILGNPNAKIKIVEYSDPSCPFCKQFNPTLQQVMKDYGPSGDVAWIYRSFPLDIHPNAKHESMAIECAAALGGNDAFWKFSNRLYEITPSDQGLPLDQTQLPEIAKFAGLDPVAFNECLSSDRFADKIEKSIADGTNAMQTTPPEQRGTPYSIIITPSGSKIPLVGAQTYDTMKNVIDTLLSQK